MAERIQLYEQAKNGSQKQVNLITDIGSVYKPNNSGALGSKSAQIYSGANTQENLLSILGKINDWFSDISVLRNKTIYNSGSVRDTDLALQKNVNSEDASLLNMIQNLSNEFATHTHNYAGSSSAGGPANMLEITKTCLDPIILPIHDIGELIHAIKTCAAVGKTIYPLFIGNGVISGSSMKMPNQNVTFDYYTINGDGYDVVIDFCFCPELTFINTQIEFTNAEKITIKNLRAKFRQTIKNDYNASYLYKLFKVTTNFEMINCDITCELDLYFNTSYGNNQFELFSFEHKAIPSYEINVSINNCSLKNYFISRVSTGVANNNYIRLIRLEPESNVRISNSDLIQKYGYLGGYTIGTSQANNIALSEEKTESNITQIYIASSSKNMGDSYSYTFYEIDNCRIHGPSTIRGYCIDWNGLMYHGGAYSGLKVTNSILTNAIDTSTSPTTPYFVQHNGNPNRGGNYVYENNIEYQTKSYKI